ncbi:hypothetical protein P8452_52299 [Trifolium repens]|nr:hypothetical protein P8452_52299 [Trifolium repens]
MQTRQAENRFGVLFVSKESLKTLTLIYCTHRKLQLTKAGEENMSESCGSNAFPNAEVEKQKTNKKRTGDVEEEVMSTTQKPYKNTRVKRDGRLFES